MPGRTRRDLGTAKGPALPGHQPASGRAGSELRYCGFSPVTLQLWKFLTAPAPSCVCWCLSGSVALATGSPSRETSPCQAVPFSRRCWRSQFSISGPVSSCCTARLPAGIPVGCSRELGLAPEATTQVLPGQERRCSSWLISTSTPKPGLPVGTTISECCDVASLLWQLSPFGRESSLQWSEMGLCPQPPCQVASYGESSSGPGLLFPRNVLQHTGRENHRSAADPEISVLYSLLSSLDLQQGRFWRQVW